MSPLPHPDFDIAEPAPWAPSPREPLRISTRCRSRIWPDLWPGSTAISAPEVPRQEQIAAGDYGMFAAEFKAGKTWAMTDLAVSVASGTPWLGIFEVERPGPVLLFAGEGGARKIARRFRAVCESRGLRPVNAADPGLPCASRT